MDEAVLRKRLVDLGLIPAEKLDDLLRKRPPEDPRTLATLVVEAGLFTRQDLLLLMGGEAEESSDDRTMMAGDRTVNADRTQMAAGNGAQKRTGSFQAAIWPPPDPSSPDYRERIAVRDTVQKALGLDPLFAPHAELTLLKDRTLGKGGMGVVLLVNDMRLGRLAALKLMKEDGTTVAVQRFLREAAITARLDHPGIPPVYEAGRTASGQHFILMRYVAGESLSQLLARTSGPPLERRDAIGILAKVGDAVAYANSKRIVHRDLKPSNIMVGAFNEVLVMDWGLARNIEETESMDAALHQRGAISEETGSASDGVTRAGAILGTLGYMSPEQARGEDVDGRADIFALGAILTEVLTGRPPITGDSVAELVRATAEGRIARPASRDQRIEPELDAIAHKALAFKAADRYASAKDLADDLRAFLEGRPVKAYRYPLAEKMRRLIRAHPTFFATLTVALLLSALALAVIRQRNAELGEVKSERDAAEQRDVMKERSRALLADARTRFRQGAPLSEVRGLALQAASAHRTALLDAGLVLAEAGDVASARDLLTACTKEFPPAYAALFALHELEGGSAGAFRYSGALRELSSRAAKNKEENELTCLAACAEAMDRSDLDGARLWASRAASRAPRFGPGFVFKAEVELRQGHVEEAGPDAEQAVVCEPGSATALDERARVRFAKGDLAGALDDATRAIGAVASDGVAYIERSRVRLARHELDLAAADAARGVELASGWAPGWCQVASVRLANGQLEDALEAARRAVDLDDRLALAWSVRAQVRLSRRDLEGAVADASAAIERDPNAPAAWITRARARLGLGDAGHAIEDATKAAELDRSSALALATIGGAHLARGELDLAIAHATKAGDLDPGLAEAWLVRATANRRKNAFEAALADATKALGIAPSFAPAWAERAAVRLALRDTDGAAADADMAVEKDPTLLGAWLVRAEVRAAKKDLDGALRDATKATELDARSPRAWLARAEAHLARHELDLAIADAQHALDLDARLARAFVARGSARAARGEIDAALADLGQALELDPGLDVAWAARAQVRLKKDDLAGAIADQTKVVEFAPRSLPAWLERASMRTAAGDLDAAIADYGKAIELDRKVASSWSRRGAVRLQKGDLDGAIDDMGKAIDLDPRNARLWNDRGWARLKRGDVDATFNDLDRALALQPDLAEAWINRALASRKKSELDRALEDVATALKLDPRAARAWLVRGLIRASKDDLTGASADYSTALLLDARLVDAWIARGEVKQSNGDLPGAIDDWTHAIQVDAHAAEAYRLRGLARASRGDDAKAVEDLERFQALAPGSRWAALVKGKLTQLRAREK